MSENINLLTNKEAAEVLRRLLGMSVRVMGGRGNGKTMLTLRIHEALMKAIYLLENTPDEVEEGKEESEVNEL